MRCSLHTHPHTQTDTHIALCFLPWWCWRINHSLIFNSKTIQPSYTHSTYIANYRIVYDTIFSVLPLGDVERITNDEWRRNNHHHQHLAIAFMQQKTENKKQNKQQLTFALNISSCITLFWLMAMCYTEVCFISKSSAAAPLAS